MEFQISSLTDPMGVKANLLFKNKFSTGFVEVAPVGAVYPARYKDMHHDLLDFEVFPDDIWVLTHPRSGTTWAQEIIWSIEHDLNFEAAKALQMARFPYLEMTLIKSPDQGTIGKPILDASVEFTKAQARPRFIKSHLNWHLLPRQLNTVKPKMVYIMRNPKDVCVSYYHYAKLFEGFSGTFEEFAELFLNDRIMFGPYWKHVLPFWEKRNEPYMLYLQYEEMKKDPDTAIKKIAEFLGKSLDEDQIAKVKEHCSFNSMKKNPSVNLEPWLSVMKGQEFLEKSDERFIRKGQVGDWKNYINSELEDKFDKWIEENAKGTGIAFD